MNIDAGAILKHRGEDRYLVCNVKIHEYCLVGMRDGFRWEDSCQVHGQLTLDHLVTDSSQRRDFELVKMGWARR